MSPPRHMCLNLFIATSGFHKGSWRRPQSRAEELTSFRLLAEMARQAEDAKMDALFIADTLGFEDATRGREPRVHFNEPLTSLAAISAVTNRIGLIGTASTTYYEPYNLARIFNSIDHLSAGRAAWNVVTSFGNAEQFNGFTLTHGDRYARAQEFMEVVNALWDSWEDDAVVVDRLNGVWADPGRIHSIDHVGAEFQVAGPLNVPRSPQGRPVIVQAGSSPEGIAFAAKHADIVFTLQSEFEGAQKFYRSLKDAVRTAGRDPDSVKVVPGLSPILGSTMDEAHRLADEVGDLINFDDAQGRLQNFLPGVQFGGLDLDKPIPLDLMENPESVEGTSQGGYGAFYKLTVQGATFRDLLKAMVRSTGHLSVIGTAQSIASQMIDWVCSDAADGFNIMPPFMPEGLDAITQLLIPELRGRGYFRSEYSGSTLREHLGIQLPSSVYARGRDA
jgi:N-acetyl-S-(2-succino)cysteine monooxygenase